MIIRTPTRTKTSSFHGQQMGFKFPSTESLPKTDLDEFHLSNHHLLNINHRSNESDEVASQILSDYTSGSNTGTNSGNSSNGYYSFANISDNTTTSAKLSGVNATNSTAAAYVLDSQNMPLLTPSQQQDHCSSGLGSSPKSSSPMEAIPENAFSSNSTIFQSIPTADNYSYRISSPISSARSLRSRKSSIVRRKQVPKLQQMPSIAQVKTSGSLTSKETNSTGSRPKTRLKRSNAVRCKGGLLQYFILLGLKLKKHLRKVIDSIRQKLFRNSTRSPVRSGSDHKKGFIKSKYRSNMATNKTDSRSSSNDHPTTSHLKRTQRYVSNLQRSMSYKSLQPVLMQSDAAKPNKVFEAKTEQAQCSKNISRPTTSLRRTNSSIRRAASVITTNPNRSHEDGPASANFSDTHHNSEASGIKVKQKSVGGLSRSTASRSLSSIVRQPSIVVKNKVIPLSMHPFSIEEEEEEEGDEYIISTNEMRPLSRTSNISTDDECYHDAEDMEDMEDMEDTSDIRMALTQNFNQYFSSVIVQRILLRLQIIKHQETGANNSYVDLMESIIKEYETPSTPTSVDPSSELATPKISIIPEGGTPHLHDNFEVRIQSSLGNSGTRLNHSSSMISLSTQKVKRSLTLPIGMKV